MICIDKFRKAFCLSNFPNYKLPKNIELREKQLRKKVISVLSNDNSNLKNGNYITKETIDLRRKRITNYVFSESHKNHC